MGAQKIINPNERDFLRIHMFQNRVQFPPPVFRQPVERGCPGIPSVISANRGDKGEVIQSNSRGKISARFFMPSSEPDNFCLLGDAIQMRDEFRRVSNRVAINYKRFPLPQTLR